MKHLKTFRLFENLGQSPLITIIVPKSDEIFTKNHDISLQANISNIEDASNITLEVNGFKFTNFRFDAKGLNDYRFDKDANFVANYLKLKPGTNEITITCQNDFGKDSKTIIVEQDRELWGEIEELTFSEDGMECSVVENQAKKYDTELETIRQNEIEKVLSFFEKELSKKNALDVSQVDIQIVKEGEVVKLIFNQMTNSEFSFCKDADDRYFAKMIINEYNEYNYKCFDFVGMEKCLMDGIHNWISKYYMTL